MSDAVEKKPTVGVEPPAGVEPSDDSRAVATGLRSTARWVAAAFAGIPSLAVVGSIVRAPGDSGFDERLLIAGVLLAALGALTGILTFASVLSPAPVTDPEITAGNLELLPEGRFTSFEALRQALEETRDAVGIKRDLASDLASYAAADEAKAVQAEAASKAMDELIKGLNPVPPDRVKEAAVARRYALTLRAAAGVSAAEAAIRKHDLVRTEQRLTSLEALRRGAYGIAIGAKINKRYERARRWCVVAVLLVSAGVACLALAPRPKSETTAAQLVTLKLEDPGRRALGCDADNVQALRVGGDEQTPLVIVLPGGDCPVKAVEFLTKKPEPFGKVIEEKLVEAS
ncbi:MAG TPA: hypothetical protein VNE62_03800 [Actinomycetota bacterium]|nr:hypothetical protein [Actinomycetota bacterium]